MRIQVQVFVDFDGTISLIDTTDLLLQRFAEPSWLDVEQAWEKGEIGSRECMVRQIDLVRATPDAFADFVRSVRLDPAFPAFARFCARLQIPLTVVSDGLDRTIEAALGRINLDLPIKANRLTPCGAHRWKLQFPHASDECRSLAGHCKCRSMVASQTLTILVGDGQSDFCAAQQADFVFAKAKLLVFCRKHALPHAPFNDFADLPQLMADWLATVAPDWRAPEQHIKEDQSHAE